MVNLWWVKIRVRAHHLESMGENSACVVSRRVTTGLILEVEGVDEQADARCTAEDGRGAMSAENTLYIPCDSLRSAYCMA